MTAPWYIYGAGGLGLETLDIIRAAIAAGQDAPHALSFVEDGGTRDSAADVPVCALDQCLPGARITIAVGEPALRRVLMDKAMAQGLQLATAISPSAFVSPLAQIAAGVVIAPFCSVQARARIDQNAAINTQAIVGHDVHVGPGAVISSQVNLGGAVHAGAECYIGMGALVREGLTIGARSIISMGSVVHKDMPEDVIAVGNPARVARRNEDRKVFKSTEASG